MSVKNGATYDALILGLVKVYSEISMWCVCNVLYLL